MTQSPRAQLVRTRRPVIKIGSAVLAGPAGQTGAPTLDRERFAGLCDDVAALAEGASGIMVALRADRIERVAIAEVLSKPKRVDPRGERVIAARSIGTIFGDETPA